MSVCRFTGNVNAVTQIDTFTPTTSSNGVFAIWIGNKSVSYATTSATVATICTNLTNSLNGSTYQEFQEATWTDSGTHITMTCDTAGKPIVALTSATSGTFTKAQPTTCTGPEFANAAGNWNTNTVPASTDSIDLSNYDGDIKYGLDMSATTVLGITIRDSFTGKIGLPKTNSDGSVEYAEYRDDYWKIGTAGVLEVHGTGSRCKINTGSGTAISVNVYGTGVTAEENLRTFQWVGTNAANALNVAKGSVAAAQFGGEAATIASLNISWKTSQQSDADVYLGPGCTLTNIVKSGGKLVVNTTFTSLNQSGGETIANTGTAASTVELSGGQLRWNSTGTIAGITLSNGGEFDKRQDLRVCTLTNLAIRKGGILRDPHKRINFASTGFGMQCPLTDATLDLGNSFTLFRAT